MNAVDTNVLIYARDPRDPTKQQKARQLTARTSEGGLLRQSILMDPEHDSSTSNLSFSSEFLNNLHFFPHKLIDHFANVLPVLWSYVSLALAFTPG